MGLPLSDRYWLGFTVDHDEDDAAARFTERFGQPPEFVFEAERLLLLGPIPEDREPGRELQIA